MYLEKHLIVSTSWQCDNFSLLLLTTEKNSLPPVFTKSNVKLNISLSGYICFILFWSTSVTWKKTMLAFAIANRIHIYTQPKQCERFLGAEKIFKKWQKTYWVILENSTEISVSCLLNIKKISVSSRNVALKCFCKMNRNILGVSLIILLLNLTNILVERIQ